MENGFENQFDQTSRLSKTVEAGFAASQEAEKRLQRSIEAMMGGIGSLAKTLEVGIAASRHSVPELPAPYESSKRRAATLALPAPLPEVFGSDSDSGIALPNFERVTKKMTDCPINSAVESLIPPFVWKFFPDNPDPAACCILAILSGKKRSVLEKMGEFTRTKVVPLITVDNHKIFQQFFAELALKCKRDSCVKVKNADGKEVSHTFHILGKEDGAILHIIRILLEEE
jgi:hypothetical protein